MKFICCDELRRHELKGKPLNGIDFLEVLDRDAPTQAERQRTLFVHFVNPLTGAALTSDNIHIEGGDRIRHITVTGIAPGADPNILTVTVDEPGDFSIYTLRVIQDAEHLQPPDGFDPATSAVEFSFKVECPTDYDCRSPRICPPATAPQPDINYLAKDYASFRRLMLDRLAALMPQWKERHAADLGVALVELLAFAGDYLSYQQDAVATEAYLGTARRRVSVRRHAQLVDYAMHDGCNARTWVHIEVDADTGPLLKGTRLFTRIVGQPTRLPNDPLVLQQAQVGFETMEDVPVLFEAHNTLPFYTWSDQRCCLPIGATAATLKGHFPNLEPGDVLILEEVLGPNSGRAEDADPSRRHAVRLTTVVHTDAHGNPLIDPLNNQVVTEIEWESADALPFPFCISARTDAEHGGAYKEDVSVARGNVVLADHGVTVTDRPFPDTVPQPTVFRPPAMNKDRCMDQAPRPIPPRYRPQLRERPMTQAAPYDAASPATSAMRWRIEDALPEIFLKSVRNTDVATWQPKKDLLNSEPDATEFVAEIETDGTAFLRFGDDRLGARPEPMTTFTATYRVGNGVSGNVGAESLVHIVTDLTEVVGIRNPLPAQGGREPESMEDVRQRAPSAFRTQERAVTPEDYAEVTERHPSVQRAAATFRWTGSWHTVFLTVDRQGGSAVDDVFEQDMRGHVELFRMAGYDLEIDGPRFVSLEIDMHVCAKPEYFRSDVKAALLNVFSNGVLPDGRKGVFHPDNFTFGRPVYLSPLYAAAQDVPGAASVLITVFQRQGKPDPKPLAVGMLPMSRLEIARLDNDPNFVERGVFRLTMGGGK
jgi:hypothetical protein